VRSELEVAKCDPRIASAQADLAPLSWTWLGSQSHALDARERGSWDVAGRTAAVISKYVEQALRRARYEPVDDGGVCATVQGLRGVIAVGATRAQCRAQLAEVVEEWVLVRVARHLPVPRLGGVSIRVRRAS